VSVKNYTTQDCISILDNWLYQKGYTLGFGQWKRLKKSKNSAGLWVRVFQNKELGFTIDIIESSMGLVVLDKAISTQVLTVKPSYLAKIAFENSFYDAEGEKLRAGSAEKTIKYYMGVKNLVPIYHGIDDTDDNGTAIKWYSFTDDDSGRDYGLLLYSDGSWIITSD
jgi:hypothetical protein